MSVVKEFHLNLPIRSYERPRFYNGVVTNSTKYKAYKQQLRNLMQQHFVEPIETVCAVSLTFKFALPRKLIFANPGTKAFGERESRLKASGGIHIQKDVDNLAKAVLDAMNRLVFVDDRQVIRINISKCYHELEHDRIEIEIIDYK